MLGDLLKLTENVTRVRGGGFCETHPYTESLLALAEARHSMLARRYTRTHKVREGASVLARGLVVRAYRPRGGVAPQPVRVHQRTQAWLSMHYLSPVSLLAAEMTEDARRLMAAAALMPAAAADTLSTEE